MITITRGVEQDDKDDKPDRRRFVIAGMATLEMPIRQPVPIWIKVVDASTGEPIPDDAVTIDETEVAGLTDSRGLIKIEALVGEHPILFDSPGYIISEADTLENDILIVPEPEEPERSVIISEGSVRLEKEISGPITFERQSCITIIIRSVDSETETTVSGDMIIIDGLELGMTDENGVLAVCLAPGPHAAKSEHPDYVDFEGSLTVSEETDFVFERERKVYEVMIRSIDSMSFDTISGDTVFIDDEEAGQTDENGELIVALKTGEHTIRFVHPDYVDSDADELANDSFIVEEEEATYIFKREPPEPPEAHSVKTYSINMANYGMVPYDSVYINGTHVGHANSSGRFDFSLPDGDYQLLFVHPDFIDEIYVLRVRGYTYEEIFRTPIVPDYFIYLWPRDVDTGRSVADTIYLDGEYAGKIEGWPYLLLTLEPGEYAVRFVHPDYVDSDKDDLENDSFTVESSNDTIYFDRTKIPPPAKESLTVNVIENLYEGGTAPLPADIYIDNQLVAENASTFTTSLFPGSYTIKTVKDGVEKTETADLPEILTFDFTKIWVDKTGDEWWEPTDFSGLRWQNGAWRYTVTTDSVNVIAPAGSWPDSFAPTAMRFNPSLSYPEKLVTGWAMCDGAWGGTGMPDILHYYLRGLVPGRSVSIDFKGFPLSFYQISTDADISETLSALEWLVAGQWTSLPLSAWNLQPDHQNIWPAYRSLQASGTWAEGYRPKGFFVAADGGSVRFYSDSEFLISTGTINTQLFPVSGGDADIGFFALGSWASDADNITEISFWEGAWE